MTFDPETTRRLIAETKEDDERMEDAPWMVHDDDIHQEHRITARNGRNEISCDMADEDAAGIARLRNNAHAIADQLEAAAKEVARLTAERDRALVAHEKWLARVWGGMTDVILDQHIEVQKLRAEVEAMRPVVEATERQRDRNDDDTDGVLSPSMPIAPRREAAVADLTDKQLDAIWDGEYGCCETSTTEAIALVEEVKRRRAAHHAGREHVERVVRDEVLEQFGDFELRYIHSDDAPDIRNPNVEITIPASRRVADRLSAPVLSDEDVVHLVRLRGWFEPGCEPEDLTPALVALDRLIAARKS